MSSALDFIGKETIFYGSMIVLILGLPGDVFNTIVFLSLRTFRQSSCAFYLTVMSLMNIFQLCFIVLSRLMLGVYGNDGTNSSEFYCKFRFFFSQFCTTFSLACFCLATFDQYCATSPFPRLRHICRIEIARLLTSIFCTLAFLHSIPNLIFFKHNLSSSTHQVTCAVTDPNYLKYRTYAVMLVFLGFLPISVTALFGSMAYFNVRNLLYYTVPLIRRELDKQLTSMVLVQIIIDIFVLLPYSIASVISLYINQFTDSAVRERIRYLQNLTLILYYFHLAVRK